MYISPSIYIILGIFVMLLSWGLDSTSNSMKMIIFFYAGTIFVAFGIVKRFILGDTRTDDNQHVKSKRPEQNFNAHCPRCQQKVNIFDNFCSKCGNYLKAQPHASAHQAAHPHIQQQYVHQQAVPQASLQVHHPQVLQQQQRNI